MDGGRGGCKWISISFRKGHVLWLFFVVDADACMHMVDTVLFRCWFLKMNDSGKLIIMKIDETPIKSSTIGNNV
jgi:hypothetical protein